MTAPHQQHLDEALILTADKTAKNHTTDRYEPSRAGKIHRRDGQGGWASAGYNIGAWFKATPIRFDGLQGLFEILKGAGSHIRDFLVGDVIRVGVNPDRLRRAKKDEAWGPGGLSPHPIGHRWICWEVDGVKNLPDWFDPTSQDRSRDADFVRWWIRHNLPAQFHGKTAILQWSSSALFRGKVAMHLWMWMDRPISRTCLHYYFQDIKHTLNDSIDVTIWDDARVHYIADPRFEQVDGSTIADPLRGWRWQWVQGELGDVAEALPEWVDQPTWEAKKAKEKAELERLVAARKARRGALVAAVAVGVAERGKKASGEKGKTKQPKGFDPVACVDEEAARKVLVACVEQIEGLGKGDARHLSLLWITLRAAKSCAGVLDESEIRDALEGPAIKSLMEHEKSPRPKAVAETEFDSLMRGAFARAKAEGSQGGADAPEFAAIGAALCPEPTATLSPPDDSPISLTGETAALDVAAAFSAEVEAFRGSFIDARAELAHLIADAVRVGGRHAVCAPAGLGKSHAICEALIANRKSRRLTPDSPVILATPDLGLARELRDDLRGRGANAVLAVTRTEKNCEKFPEFILAGRLTPGGGKTLCEHCDLHPRRAGSADACPFWRAFSAQQKADFICGSHALEALKGELVTAGSERGEAAPPPVRIDWASFGLIERGDTAAPWVKRTAKEITIGARACYKVGEGSEPPTPEYETTPRWTSASKTALVEWVATALKCDADRASVVEAITQGRTVKAFFDWSAIGKLAGEVRPYRPVAYLETQGWLRGWHITVERATGDEGGRPLPEIEFTGTYPLTAPSKAAIRAWIRAAWGVEHDFACEEHARANIHEWPIDALVIDESILHALRYGGSLTRGQITDLRLAGEIGGEGVDALLGLMWRSEENKSAKDKKKPHYFPSNVLAESVGPIDVIGQHESGAALLRDALRLDDKDQRIGRLSQGWNWEAVEALRSCLGAGWAGAHIEGGMLHVAAPRRLNTEGCRVVVLLDATMTEAQATASLGKAATYSRVKAGQSPHLEVIHVPTELGPRAGAWGDADGPRTTRSASHLVSALKRYGGPNTVSFLHKRALDGERCWVAGLVEDGRYGAMTYHGASQSRGSNKYRGFSTCIMTGHHVPRSARRQQAELLARMNGEVYSATPEAAEKWNEEAAWLLEGGATVQELARIRPLDATANNPKRLIILDKRAPEAFGIRTTEAIHPDRLACEEGMGVAAIEDDLATALETIRFVTAETISLAGGVLPTGGDGKTWTVPYSARMLAGLQEMTRCWRRRQDIETAATSKTLSQRVDSWCGHYFRGDWRAFAKAARVDLTEVHLPGRPPLPILHVGTLNQGTLEAHLASRGYLHYRLSPSSPLVTVGGFGEDDALYRALYRVVRADVEGQALGTIYKTLALASGVSLRTVQRWVDDRRLETEDNRAALVRLWAIVRATAENHMRDEAERLASETGRTPAESASIVAAIFRAEGIAPWEIAAVSSTITPIPHPSPQSLPSART